MHNKPKIYAAGKTWKAAEFREMRDKYGFNIISRWIDNKVSVLTDPDDIHPDSVLYDESYKRDIWEYGCKEDCLNCDLMIWSCSPEDGNLQSGALVELGHVTMLGKPVYIIGTCESVEPIGVSNRAWKSQSIVHHWPEITDPYWGFTRAIHHYETHYLRGLPVCLPLAASRS